MSKIYGNTIGTTTPRSDWNQTDSTKADYIKNKPTLGSLASKDTVEKSDLASDIQSTLNKADNAIQSLDGYATVEVVEAAKNEAISSSNASTDEKLQNYSTTTESENFATIAANNAKSEAIANTDTKLASYSTTNQMDNAINTKATDVLAEAKSYTDIQTAGLASATVVNTSINTHDTSTTAHNDIRGLIADLTTKLNNFLDIDDTTKDQLSEIIGLINNNKEILEAFTTSKINVSDIVNNLTTNSTSKVLSAAQGVVIKGLIDDLQGQIDDKANTVHTHTISDVTNLQTTLDNKVPTSRKVNGKALTTDIALSASDVNAYSKTEIDSMELITVDDIDAICGTTIQVATASEVTF